MKEYVCGFMFNLGEVVLILKQRPDRQAGLFNGVGGVVKPGETPRRAMAREFREETGAETFESDWVERVVLTGGGRRVRFYSAVRDADVTTTTDEEVGRYDENALPVNSLWDIRWLIPLCLSPDLEFPVLINDNPSFPC